MSSQLILPTLCVPIRVSLHVCTFFQEYALDAASMDRGRWQAHSLTSHHTVDCDGHGIQKQAAPVTARGRVFHHLLPPCSIISSPILPHLVNRTATPGMGGWVSKCARRTAPEFARAYAASEWIPHADKRSGDACCAHALSLNCLIPLT